MVTVHSLTYQGLPIYNPLYHLQNLMKAFLKYSIVLLCLSVVVCAITLRIYVLYDFIFVCW